jgi:lipopolysaccharide heptosyltransferase II
MKTVSINKILIIQTASIGDVILATPVIEKLAHFYPDAKIDVLVKKGIEPIIFNNPKIHKIFAWDKTAEKYSRLWQLMTSLREENYDAVVNLQRFFSSGLITVFSGAPIKLGFDKNPLSFFYTRKTTHRISKNANESRHEVERNLSTIAPITDVSMDYLPKIYPSKSDFARVSKFKNQKYVCIAPASLWFTKQFPAEKWIEFAGRLDDDVVVYFLGAAGDEPLAEEIITKSGHSQSLNLCGKITLLQSAALMRDAAMNFVNDSAPLHIASAMNANVTAIFCSTVPAFGFGPLSNNSTVIEVDEKLKCRPCGLHGFKACPKKHFKCAMQINTQKLIDRML